MIRQALVRVIILFSGMRSLIMLNTSKWMLLLIAVWFVHCDASNADPVLETTPIKRVPDKTPFISGIIEASFDTTHYHTQVVVGYVTDSKSLQEYTELRNIPTLYSPTLWSQVVHTARRFMLQFEAEDRAEVFIRGPLDTQYEQTVALTSEGFGVYGDVRSELKLLPGNRYQLLTKLPNGDTYQAKTYIPQEVQIQLPDSMGINVQLNFFGDGEPYEASEQVERLSFNHPENSKIAEIQSNTTIDKYILFLEDWEDFAFSDRGSDFLRTGVFYGIYTNESLNKNLRKGWWRPIGPKWTLENPVQTDYMRFSFYSDGFWDNHQDLSSAFVGSGKDWHKMNDNFFHAISNPDSTYLFEVSTIRKVGENDRVLPQSQLDAIGFFAGNFSVYKKIALYPIRNFDIDSVLTIHGVSND